MKLVLPILFLDFFLNLASDFTLIMKIFVFMSIINFVKNHVGENLLAILVTIVFSWYALFVAFPLFGTLYLLYILLTLGIAGVIIDYFFVSGSSGAPPEGSPVSSGADIASRMARIQRRGR